MWGDFEKKFFFVLQKKKMSEPEANGGVDASSRLLNGEKQISMAGDLDRTARPTKNKETAKQLKIVEKESK